MLYIDTYSQNTKPHGRLLREEVTQVTQNPFFASQILPHWGGLKLLDTGTEADFALEVLMPAMLPTSPAWSGKQQPFALGLRAGFLKDLDRPSLQQILIFGMTGDIDKDLAAKFQ